MNNYFEVYLYHICASLGQMTTLAAVAAIGIPMYSYYTSFFIVQSTPSSTTEECENEENTFQGNKETSQEDDEPPELEDVSDTECSVERVD